MPAKLTITGVPTSINQVTHEDKNIWCIEFITGGSPQAPKDLPLPTREVKYSVLLNDKQMKKLVTQSKNARLDLHSSKLLVMGDPYKGLDDGVICFQIENLDIKKKTQQEQVRSDQSKEEDNKPNLKRPKSPMQLTSLKIPDELKEMSPRRRDEYKKLVQMAINYYEEHGQFEKPILLEKVNIAWVIKGNYETYLAARRLDLKLGPVDLFQP